MNGKNLSQKKEMPTCGGKKRTTRRLHHEINEDDRGQTLVLKTKSLLSSNQNFVSGQKGLKGKKG
jgi:hypothetical protein